MAIALFCSLRFALRESAHSQTCVEQGPRRHGVKICYPNLDRPWPRARRSGRQWLLLWSGPVNRQIESLHQDRCVAIAQQISPSGLPKVCAVFETCIAKSRHFPACRNRIAAAPGHTVKSRQNRDATSSGKIRGM